ncbi:hypothetical protein [Nocardioides sp.]|jgi:hypothetical protein|uniref:hypothetical protein n=1 Tax=Nocardioides sp. TaxID=35761 RepID=UPI00260598CC|nr:hypothetical protein [Nocardioides sp.]
MTTPSRLARPAVALGAIALLGGLLTACADEYDSTKCGEYLDFSQDEKISFVTEALEAQASDDEVAQFEELGGEAAYDQFATAFTTLCEAEDPDKTLGEISEEVVG